MELLLINHPLDCPMCDKGGECPLQNQAMSNGQGETRFAEDKRTFAKPVAISTEVLLDRERCISCARCIRFSEQIAGDPFIDFFERGPSQQIGTAEGKPFDSYFSGNTVQICPVGALTGAAYRFRSRPFDLVSTPSVCEHCASGCRQRTDHRRGRVTAAAGRRGPGRQRGVELRQGPVGLHLRDPARPADHAAGQGRERGAGPGVLAGRAGVAAAGRPALRATARGPGGGVLTGGRLTLEDAYAYAKFARIALGTNDIDMRARPHSAEEAAVPGRRAWPGAASRSATPTWSRPRPCCWPGSSRRTSRRSSSCGCARRSGSRGLRGVLDRRRWPAAGLGKLSGALLTTLPGDEAGR